MGMAVNTNLAAINSQRNLSNTQNDLSKSLEKLSSGLRINRAADDAAGLSISEGLRSQVNGYTVAARNAQDGISVIQTAEGALTETHSILQRMRDLAVQAGNDSNNANGREAIDKEVKQLTKELDRISESTNFNGIKLLNGDNSKLTFQVGADGNSNSQIDLNLASVKSIANALGAAANGGTTFKIAAFDATTGAPTGLAAGAYSFESVKGGVTSSITVTTTAGAATAEEFVAKLNADQGFAGTFTASLERNANGTGTGIVIKANDGGTVDLTAPSAAFTGGATAAPGTGGMDFSSASGAQNAITLLDQQIKAVSTARSDLGAVQNRFESAINTLNVGRENLTAAESRIRDVDMAAEMVKFTKANILSQAGTSMLAQANQSSQGVLSLLR